MSILNHLTVRAEHICAYLWHRASMEDRRAICRQAATSDVVAMLDWYELGAHERTPIMSVVLDQIDKTAANLRIAHRLNHQEENRA